jgi:adenylate cyclase
MMWVPHEVYEREQFGDGSFLTEFRPCAALFVRFVGIDFDAEDAQSQLDRFVKQAQEIAVRHDGTLINLTIGDKGSYAYINFGALRAHEDDARRAVKTALELKEKSNLQLHMGLAQGVMRVGAYGSVTRKTFGALGDDVNLAARLMTTAALNEILLSSQAQKAVANDFTFEPRLPLPMKGKAEPLPVFALTGERQQRAVRLQEPNYALPMVGRENELRVIEEKLALAANAKGQVIGVMAGAGMGKSRLVAEVIRKARKKGFVGYGGACQSDGINTPYLAWKPIWQAFFDVDPFAPLKKQLRNLEGELEDRVPERVQAMPLLGIMLNLDISDNDFTENLEPQYKQSALRALLDDCLRAAAKEEPLLIVIEDLHWIDALSQDLLEELARDLSDCRVCFLLAYRPPHFQRLQERRLEAMLNFTGIELHGLTQAEAEQVIRAKLAQLYPARSGAVPPALVQKLIARAQGNPFYLEELLNYLRDRGLDPREPQALEKIELPDSLHTLILSRLDQLSEREKITLRIASIVGRLFRAAWLTGYYPELGELPKVKNDLDQLAEMDITPLDSEPELTYLFKHIVTHEVTYESLPFTTRAKLHEQLAQFLERQIAAGAMAEASMLDTLVYHYTHSENRAKQYAYLRKAGGAAMEVSAFNTAVEYFARLMELIPSEDIERAALALQLAEAHYRLSDYPAARGAIEQAQAAAQTNTDRASALALLGEMTSELGDYAESKRILAEAVPLARASGDGLTLCRALYALGDVNWRLGKLDNAKAALKESLGLARSLGDVTRELFALYRLGAVYFLIDVSEAEQLVREAQSLAVSVGNRERAMRALNGLGVIAGERKNYERQQEYSQQALAFAREIGDQWSMSAQFINLAECDIKLGDLTAARMKLREGLVLAIRIGALPLVVSTVVYFAKLAHAEGQTEQALALFGLARSHPSWSSEDQHDLEVALAEWALDPSMVEAGLAKGAESDWEKTIRELLG